MGIKVRDTPLSRQGLNGILKELSRDLEEAGVVPPGKAKEVPGILLRAGRATEAAACGMEKQLPPGHGRWKSLSGPEAYERNAKRKFERVSAMPQAPLRQTELQRREASARGLATGNAEVELGWSFRPKGKKGMRSPALSVRLQLALA